MCVCVCVVKILAGLPVLWLCHSVLPAVCPPSRPLWLQAIPGMAMTFTPEHWVSSLPHTDTHTERYIEILCLIFWTEMTSADEDKMMKICIETDQRRHFEIFHLLLKSQLWLRPQGSSSMTYWRRQTTSNCCKSVWIDWIIYFCIRYFSIRPIILKMTH